VRVLIVSDIHANLAALEAVLRSAGSVDAVWSLGDCVGYGPQPTECVARLRDIQALMIAGNHERAATGAIGVTEFNPLAAQAALWTRETLAEETKGFLDALPEVESRHEFTLVHGTLRWPIWEYLMDYDAALGHLARQETPFGLVGHTHVPALVVQDTDLPRGCELYYLKDGQSVELNTEQKLVINPGSVGQPRDGDPRASYAVWDTNSQSITIHRVEYDIRMTQRLMENARLPRPLIERLSVGR
jgi:diadenosine tetraphosphatase ApaH/serine/threonine PP2A family protein phosphatase